MKIDSQLGNSVIQKNVDTTEFKIKASTKSFKLVFAGLYSDKLGSTIRELVSNAVDSHRLAKTNKSIKLELPTILNNEHLIVEDFGVGMSHDEIMHTYITIFESTKENNDEDIGGWGLGSKTPFSISENFTVESTKDGTCNCYYLFLDNGIPNITLVNSYKKEQSGVKVSIPLTKDKFYELTDRKDDAIKWVKYMPNLDIDFRNKEQQKADLEFINKIPNFSQTNKYYIENHHTNSIIVYLKNIPYEIKNSKILSAIKKYSYPVKLHLQIDYKDISIDASRENITISSDIENRLISQIEKEIKTYKIKYNIRFRLTKKLSQIDSFVNIYKNHPLCERREYQLRKDIINQIIDNNYYSFKYSKSYLNSELKKKKHYHLIKNNFFKKDINIENSEYDYENLIDMINYQYKNSNIQLYYIPKYLFRKTVDNIVNNDKHHYNKENIFIISYNLTKEQAQILNKITGWTFKGRLPIKTKHTKTNNTDYLLTEEQDRIYRDELKHKDIKFYSLIKDYIDTSILSLYPTLNKVTIYKHQQNKAESFGLRHLTPKITSHLENNFIDSFFNEKLDDLKKYIINEALTERIEEKIYFSNREASYKILNMNDNIIHTVFEDFSFNMTQKIQNKIKTTDFYLKCYEHFNNIFDKHKKELNEDFFSCAMDYTTNDSMIKAYLHYHNISFNIEELLNEN